MSFDNYTSYPSLDPETMNNPPRINSPSTFDILKIKKLTENAILPKKGTPESAGFDLYAIADEIIPSRYSELGKSLKKTRKPADIPINQKILKTNLSMMIQTGYEGHIRPRSGLAMKGISTMAGTIDSDYRGDVGVVLINHGDNDVLIKKGERMAQILFKKTESPEIVEVLELENTIRGSGGYGSTGR